MEITADVRHGGRRGIGVPLGETLGEPVTEGKWLEGWVNTRLALLRNSAAWAPPASGLAQADTGVSGSAPRGPSCESSGTRGGVGRRGHKDPEPVGDVSAPGHPRLTWVFVGCLVFPLLEQGLGRCAKRPPRVGFLCRWMSTAESGKSSPRPFARSWRLTSSSCPRKI